MKTKIKLLLCLSPIFVLMVGCNKNSKPTINTITSKEYNVLERDTADKTFKPNGTKISLNTINDSPIRYFDLEYYNNNFLKIQDEVDPKVTKNLYTYKVENNTATFQNTLNDGKAVLDYDKQTITYTKPSAFFSVSSKPITDCLSSGSDHLFNEKWLDNFTYTSNKETNVLNLSKYSIKLFSKDGKMYLPYNLCGTLFCHGYDDVPFFSGNNFYKSYQVDSNKSENLEYIEKVRNDSTVFTKEYMEYSYNAFALTLDFRFGLKTKLLRETGKEYTYLKDGAYSYLSSFKDRMISLEKNVSNNAYIEFFNLYLNDGGHASYSNLNMLVDKTHNYKAEGENKITNDTYDNLTNSRNKFRKDIKPFTNNGFVEILDKTDTAFVSFDEFFATVYPSVETDEKNYYLTTDRTIEWANKKIIESNNNGNTIKKLVIDLSLNGGGAANVAAFVVSWALGNKEINMKLRSTFDDAFVEGKVKANETKYKLPDSIEKVYVLTSFTTFSSANYCAVLFDDQGGDKVQFIGTNTGGGSCNVYNLVNTLGSSMRLSGDLSLERNDSTMQKTHNDEEGVKRDFLKRINCYGPEETYKDEIDLFYNHTELIKELK